MTVPQPPPEAGRSAVSELLDRRRMLVIFLILVVEFAIFFAGLLTPVSVSTQRTLANETSGQFGIVQSGTPAQLAGFIFAHNLLIAAADMIPGLGVLVFVFTMYSTGLAAQAIVAASGYPGQLGAFIFVFPYSLVELSAYAVAVGAGSMLLVSWRRRRLGKEIRVFALEGALVALILLIAAVMESATIKVSVLLGFALWLPTGLALATIIVLSGRKKKWPSST